MLKFCDYFQSFIQIVDYLKPGENFPYYIYIWN